MISKQLFEKLILSPNWLFGLVDKNVDWHFCFFVHLTGSANCLHLIDEMNNIDAINHIDVNHETVDSGFTVTLGNGVIINSLDQFHVK